MNRGLVITLASLLLSAAAEPEQQASSAWRHNTRSRTEAGIRSQERGDAESAQAAFRQALSLSPAEPLMQFNAGTAALLGSAEDAVELLEPATRTAQGALRSTALYNLGNAHMAAADFTSAIEAYKESLRLTPDRDEAKHNLEIALRRLQQQQQQQQPEQQNEQRDEQQEEQDQDEQQSSNDQEDSRGENQQPPEEQQSPSNPGERQLPDFEDQPDMTAEQAAAILEAVENLEREQRRQQALEQLKRVKGDRDW